MRGVIVRLVLFLIVLTGLIYGGYYLWQNRDTYFFKGGEIKTNEQTLQDKQKISSDDTVGDEESDANENADNNKTDKDEKNEKDDDGEYFVPVIHKSDCENECASRKSVEIEYKYCREVCGFNEIKDKKDPIINNSEEDCDDIEDSFEEDVCWKEKAIREKNDKYCDEIYSEALSKVCHNRVLEEIMN